MNQFSPQEESSVILAQLQDPHIQRMIHIIRDAELPPNPVNFESPFFQKLFKNRNRLEGNHEILHRKYFDQTVEVTSKQIVLSDNIVDDIIRRLNNNPMQRQPGSSKKLIEPRKKSNAHYLAPKVQSYVDNCQTCIWTKPCQNSCIRQQLERNYDPCEDTEDIIEIDLLGERLNSEGYSYKLTVCDVFSRYIFAVPLRKPDTISIVRALLQIFLDKGTAFTSQLMTELVQASRIKIDHATLKHA